MRREKQMIRKTELLMLHTKVKRVHCDQFDVIHSQFLFFSVFFFSLFRLVSSPSLYLQIIGEYLVTNLLSDTRLPVSMIIVREQHPANLSQGFFSSPITITFTFFLFSPLLHQWRRVQRDTDNIDWPRWWMKKRKDNQAKETHNKHNRRGRERERKA